MNDAFEYRFEILKKELESIDSSIRKIDDIGNSIKNWAILTWTGSMALFLGKPELHALILITAIPPMAFMLTDAHWRRIQRRFTFRQGKISDFLNSKNFDQAVADRDLKFDLLDPISRKEKERESFQKFISLRKILSFPTVSLIYLSMSAMSVLLAIAFEVAPLNKHGHP